jgi:hypothetical protein
MKQCPQCAREGRGPKLLVEFSLSKKAGDGRQGTCRACVSAYNKKNLDARREDNRRWRANNGDRSRKTHREWAKRNPLAMTAKSLKNEYGMTVAQYAALFIVQQGRCAICNKTIKSQLENTRGLSLTEKSYVDHCHTTSRVRGLLCFNCNVGLGKFRDDEKILLSAVRYLQTTSQRAFETATEISRVCDVTAQGEKRVDASRHLVSSTSRGRRLQELSPFFN